MRFGYVPLCGSGGNFSAAKPQMHGTRASVTRFESENPFHDIDSHTEKLIVSHEKEVKGERPPFTMSFSHVTSTISACPIPAAGVVWYFLFCDASIGSFHNYEVAGIGAIY
jgi:hypothetical protein